MADAETPSLRGVLIGTSPDGYAEMRRFYSEILGLRPRSDRPGFVNFEWGGVRLTLNLHSRVKGSTTEPHRILLNFGVTDLASWHQRMLESEVVCHREPCPEPWGGLVATYSDPDGNLVQLLQF